LSVAYRQVVSAKQEFQTDYPEGKAFQAKDDKAVPGGGEQKHPFLHGQNQPHFYFSCRLQMRFSQVGIRRERVAGPRRPFDFFAVAICQERVSFTRDV
jgi:hypothetical protein